MSFAVWAPNALRVSVVGNFNHWDGRQHPLRVRGSTGVWEIFIPGLREGELYKFEIKGRITNYLGLKSDPYGFYSELRPKTASIVYDLDRYTWNDQTWMAERTGAPGVPRPAGDLRSSSGLVAALAGGRPSRPELSRTRRAVGGIRRARWDLRTWN